MANGLRREMVHPSQKAMAERPLGEGKRKKTATKPVHEQKRPCFGRDGVPSHRTRPLCPLGQGCPFATDMP